LPNLAILTVNDKQITTPSILKNVFIVILPDISLGPGFQVIELQFEVHVCTL